MIIDDKIKIFREEGISKIKIVSDFDGTLTKQYRDVDTRENNSVSVFRNEGYLDERYSDEAKQLFSKYHKIELDDTISKEEKAKYMEEWWTSHWEIMKVYGMNREVVDDVVKRNLIKIRSCFDEFVKLLNKNRMPLFIFSSGTGNLIEEYLVSRELNFSLVKVISNIWKFDSKGNFIGIKNKIIHAQNKDVSVLKDWFKSPYEGAECLVDYSEDVFDGIEKKSNVILIGDSLHDINMCNNYDNVIKIGYISKVLGEEKRKEFENVFDLVIDDSEGLEKVIDILKKIIE
ncbi:MAG: hypothetical protein PF569_06245 [Candidatus Woesearchaeota archaeon]|jgi:HAD superfamily hydrolase (TIGR01544 family)|nr:hypothetical protein [Candidatus Woesearchaeota archaeon]